MGIERVRLKLGNSMGHVAFVRVEVIRGTPVEVIEPEKGGNNEYYK